MFLLYKIFVWKIHGAANVVRLERECEGCGRSVWFFMVLYLHIVKSVETEALGIMLRYSLTIYLFYYVGHYSFFCLWSAVHGCHKSDYCCQFQLSVEQSFGAAKKLLRHFRYIGPHRNQDLKAVVLFGEMNEQRILGKWTE